MVVTPLNFYGENKFCLWIDLRTYEDNNTHGFGLRLLDAQDGITLEITRTADSTNDNNINGYIFVVSDAHVNVDNGNLTSVMY